MTDGTAIRTRREPPRFRRVAVGAAETLTPRLTRVTFVGPELRGFRVEQPAASIRLLLPSPGSEELAIPTWNGNEFLLADGTRPLIRTFTPRRFRPDTLELELEIVMHDGGAVSAWARAAKPGDPAAVSGPGRGYIVDPAATAFLLCGDESAIPAIGQLLEALPMDVDVQVIIEVAHPDARLSLPPHAHAVVEWCDLGAGAPPGDALIDAVQRTDLGADARVWAAGEAAAMHRLRRHLFDERGLARDQATVRGYWKRARGSSD